MDPNHPLLINGSQPSPLDKWIPTLYQEGRVGIHLTRWEGWDPFIKRGGLGSIYQEGRVGIHLSRGEGWDPVIKRLPRLINGSQLPLLITGYQPSPLDKWIPTLPS
jgi:hypothetical protein